MLRPFILTLAFVGVQTLNIGLQLGAAQAKAAFRCEESFKDSSTSRSWAIAAYESRISVLEDFFVAQHGRPVSEIVEAALQVDLRSKVFLLQSLTKTFKSTNGEFFTPLREEFKSLEDDLGHLALARSLRLKAEELGEPALVEHFQTQEKASEVSYEKFLAESGWLLDPRETALKLRLKLNGFDSWPALESQREFLVNRIIKTVKNLHQDVKAESFDNPDIEQGLHELRRRLRWLGLQVQSFQGLVALQGAELPTDKLKSWYASMKATNPNLSTNKYAVLSPALIENPVLIPQEYYVMLSQLIGDLGTLKDGAETEILFAEAMSKLGLSKTRSQEVTAKLRATLSHSNVDHQTLSATTEKQLRKSKFFKEFAKSLETMNKFNSN